MIGVEPDKWLKKRSGALKRQSDQADLCKVQMKRVLQDWIYRRNQRLNRVVKQVRKTDCQENSEYSVLGSILMFDCVLKLRLHGSGRCTTAAFPAISTGPSSGESRFLKYPGRSPPQESRTRTKRSCSIRIRLPFERFRWKAALCRRRHRQQRQTRNAKRLYH